MKRSNYYSKLNWILIFLINGSILSNISAQNRSAYESYYLKVGDYPTDATHDWNPNGTESQGVTHDDSNWYFTSTDYDGGNARIWRVPVYVALSQDVLNKGFDITVTQLINIPALATKRYWHWGDPDHFKYNGIDYIIVPMTSDTPGNTPAIAIFRAPDLLLIAFHTFPSGGDLPSIGWCAIAPNGDLFTSNDDANVLERYTINWPLLESSNQLSMKYASTYVLHDANGSPLGILHNMQGGEFTPSGELLYISCGSGECYVLGIGGGHGVYDTDGIHVFETSTWKEIMRSTNIVRGQTSYFNYQFDNGCTCISGSQTPEGLTIWDLNDGRAPNITGQLHVIVNLYNRYAVCDDALSIQHFGGKIYVDSVNGLPPAWTLPPSGTPIGSVNYGRPFKTVSDAVNFYPIWDGAELVILPGSYPEKVTISTRSLIESNGGTVAIGGLRNTFSGVQLFDQPNYKGNSRFLTSDCPNLNLITFPDVTASVKIFNVKEAQLYDWRDYGGGYLSVTQDIPDLPVEWKNRVGSVIIIP